MTIDKKQFKEKNANILFFAKSIFQQNLVSGAINCSPKNILDAPYMFPKIMISSESVLPVALEHST